MGITGKVIYGCFLLSVASLDVNAMQKKSIETFAGIGSNLVQRQGLRNIPHIKFIDVQNFSTSKNQKDSNNNPISQKPALGSWKTVILPFRMVPEGFECAIQTFGKASNFLGSGLNFVIPLVQQYRLVSLQRISAAIPLQTTTTSDGVQVELSGMFVYGIKDPHTAAYKVQNLEREITSVAAGTLRTGLGKMTLSEAISGGRDTLRKDILDAAALKEKQWGAELLDIEIISLDPVPEVAHFMNKQREAESLRNAAEHEAAASRKTKEQNAAAEKSVTLIGAQAKLEAAKMDAEAKIIAQEAEVKSLEMLALTLRENPEAANYLFAKLGSETWEKAASKGTTWVVGPEIVQNLLSPFLKASDKK
jgi:regulator of protease activity HflC (stomatin/prohibitin superfamily)